MCAFWPDRRKPNGYRSRCKDCPRADHGEFYRTHPGFSAKVMQNLVLRSHGLTRAEYDRMAAEQDGKCAICGNVETRFKGRLSIDHDHRTEQVRALLCGNCNGGLGLFKDNVTTLLRAIAYLNQHRLAQVKRSA